MRHGGGGVRSTVKIVNPHAIVEAGSPQADGSEALVVRFPSLPSRIGGVRSTAGEMNLHAVAVAGSPQTDGREALVVRFPSLPSAGAMVLGPCTARGHAATRFMY